MEPCVKHTHINKSIDPFFRKQVFVVRLTKAGADAGHYFIGQAILKPLHRRRIDSLFATTLIADDLRTFDADQRSNVSATSQPLGNFVGYKVAVSENLKVRVRMSFQYFEQLFVHEWLTTEQSEEDIALLLGAIDHAIERVYLDLVLLVSYIYPTTLASQVTAVDDGDIKIGRKEFTLSQTTFVLLNAQQSFEAHVPRELPEQAFIRLKQHSFQQAKVHIAFLLFLLSDLVFYSLPKLRQVSLAFSSLMQNLLNTFDHCDGLVKQVSIVCSST